MGPGGNCQQSEPQQFGALQRQAEAGVGIVNGDRPEKTVPWGENLD
jgi:hypothetical protein